MDQVITAARKSTHKTDIRSRLYGYLFCLWLIVLSLITISVYATPPADFTRKSDPRILKSSKTFDITSLKTPTETEIDVVITGIMANFHVPGVAAAIVKGEHIVWTGAYGYACIEDNILVTDTTSFMLASISKTFTGATLMHLWERAYFDLDDNINDHLPFTIIHPYFPATPITIRNLMTHTAAMRDNWTVMDSLYTLGDSPIPLGEYVEGYFRAGGIYYNAGQNYQTYEPGTRWSYCNEAIALAAYLVEAMTGIPFDIYSRDSIFLPMGLTHTSWFLAGLDTANVAYPYVYSGGQQIRYEHYGYPDYPAGQLRASAVDLARQVAVFLNHGRIAETSILDSATVEQMLTVQFPDINSRQGLIWYRSMVGDRWVWEHGGGDVGVSTKASFCPDDNLGVVVLTNGSNHLATSNIVAALYDYGQWDIVVASDSFDDSNGGDGDGIPEGGETVSLICAFVNRTPNTISDLRITCSCDDAAINFSNATIYPGTIAPFDTVSTESDPIIFTVPDNYIPRRTTFTLHAEWDGQVGDDSMIIVRTIGKPSICIVDDDNGDTMERFYTSILDDKKIPYAICDPAVDSLSDIIGYEIVIWFTGNHRASPLNDDRIIAMQTYFDAGGRLFLTGQGIAEQLALDDPSFMADYLHVDYLSNELIPVLHAAVGGTIFALTDTIAIYGSGGAGNQTSPDHLIPVNDGFGDMTYLGSADYGAISYNGSYRLVYFGFGFEGIVSGDSRWTEPDEILDHILDFFEYRKPAVPVSISISPGDPMHMIDHTPDLSWSYGGDTQASYHLQVGSDNEWTTAEMWDTGPVAAAETIVTYAGEPLADGDTYYLRLRLFDGSTWSYWYYACFRLNTPPTIPTDLWPNSLAVVENSPPCLSHTNSTDAEGDNIWYAYEVYDDSQLSSLVAHSSDHPQCVGGTTIWEMPEALSYGEDYYWRVCAGDDFENGPWSEVASFVVAHSYVCGDASGDGQVDVADAVWLVNYIFKHGPAPEPPDAGDANADGQINIGDAVWLINYVFKGGPEPQCP